MIEEIKALIDFGLNQREAEIYIELNKGVKSVWELSKSTKLSRSSIYHILERLKSKGMISEIKEEKSTKFKSIEPETIIKRSEEITEELKNTLPKLKFWNKNTTKAEIFIGTRAFLNLLNNFLDKKEDILVYGIPKNVPKILRGGIERFHKKRINLKIKMKHIYNYDAFERIKYLNSLDYTEAKAVRGLKTEATTNICGDEVLITIRNNPLWTIRITSKKISEAHKKYFEFLWKTADYPERIGETPKSS